MQSKSLLIAIAAFAVTATGAQAYVGTKYIDESVLSTEQRDAFDEARKLRQAGDVDKARDLLLEAGVTDETLDSLRQASHNSHAAMVSAVEAGDFSAFRTAIEGTPLYDIVTSEADFVLFKEAHDLKMQGKADEAEVIMDELGVPARNVSMRNGRMGQQGGFLELSDEQRDALRAARQANDQETVSAILKEVGVTESTVERRMDRHSWR